MCKIFGPRTLFVAGAIAFAVGFGSSNLAHGGPSSAVANDAPFRGCYVELAPRAANQEVSEVVREDCFDDPAEAAEFGSTLHSADSVHVIFGMWADAGFGGSYYEFYNTVSCSGDYGYNDFNVIGWNDRAGSARSACGRDVNLWEHTYQQGASLYISGYASSLGIMNDESSSWDTVN